MPGLVTASSCIGQGDRPLIAREFSKLCGDDAADILATFCTFLAALAYSAVGGYKSDIPVIPGLPATNVNSSP
jgi:hypothetical protein